MTSYQEIEEIVQEILSTKFISVSKKILLYDAVEKDRFAIATKYAKEMNAALLDNETSKEARQACNHIFHSYFLYEDAPAEKYESILRGGYYHPMRLIALNKRLPLGTLLNDNIFIVKDNPNQPAMPVYQDVIDDARKQSMEERKDELVEYAYKQLEKSGLPSVESITPEMALKICNYKIQQ